MQVLMSRFNNIRMELKRAVEFGNPESLTQAQIFRKVTGQGGRLALTAVVHSRNAYQSS
jgi:hypothetical protein